MPDPEVRRIPVELIRPNPRNPRPRLERLDELAESIAAHGLLQPIIVRPWDGEFQIVAGHRRFAAIGALNWADVPAIVRAVEDEDAYVLSLVENLQRDNLTAKEEARALELLIRERGWTTRDLARAIKRSQAYVSKRMRVFDDVTLAPYVLRDQLSVSIAEELLPLPRARKAELARRAAAEGWVRLQVRAALGKAHAAATGSTSVKMKSSTLDKRVRELRAGLRTVDLWELTEKNRRELRLLYMDLAMLAKAPAQPRERVFPPLPAASSTRRRR
jgi:ParB family chromosome partitioning protein